MSGLNLGTTALFLLRAEVAILCTLYQAVNLRGHQGVLLVSQHVIRRTNPSARRRRRRRTGQSEAGRAVQCRAAPAYLPTGPPTLFWARRR